MLSRPATAAETNTGRARHSYRKGDVVRVRSREAILATLDADGDLAGLPFMPEMLQHCGQEFEVHAPVHKTCDTIRMFGTCRQMDHTVHLSGVRCDGSAHGGCQASCLLFWREDWLERLDGTDNPDRPETSDQKAAAGTSAATLAAATQRSDETGTTVYRCQATEHLKASTHLSGFSPGQYVTDLRSAGVSPRTMLVGLAATAFNKLQRLSRRLPRWLRIRGGEPYPFVVGTGDGRRSPGPELAPGDLVEVRSKEEIMSTLDSERKNGGMAFDADMLRYCGKQARVERFVDRIIDEPTGKMIKLRDCVVLSDVVCQGVYHRFCQRNITAYWRSAWLKRIEQ